MYRLLSDLRILRLATHMEETFERYEEGLRDLIPHVPIRARLANLFEDTSAHHRLKETYVELTKEARALEMEATTADILQTLMDCEKAAHEFYVHYLDRLSDPSLVALFKELAADENRHVAAVEAAQTMLSDFPERASQGVES